jgi:hypothetical protein
MKLLFTNNGNDKYIDYIRDKECDELLNKNLLEID